MKIFLGNTSNNLIDLLVNAVADEYLSSDIFDEKLAILDPYCKNGLVLGKLNNELKRRRNTFVYAFGIFEEKDVMNVNKQFFNSKRCSFIIKNCFIPSATETAYDYWNHRIKKKIGCVVSDFSDVSRSLLSKELKKAGYAFSESHFDNYIPIMELSLRLVEPNGVLGFIVPNSFFLEENREFTDFLLKNSEIKGILHFNRHDYCETTEGISVIVLRKFFSQ